jgi:serine protease Do
LEQAAIQAAVTRVAPSVVKIETVGGLERIGNLRLNTGPTTGLIVSAEGHIISSAFNFIARPSSILVALPDGTRTPARLVAHDRQRMLVLLKVDVEEKLPVPEAVPESEIHVGQWAIALGRTLDTPQPNLSVGIVSGLNRIWGTALQTDAKISPSNYGGPLVDIRGRVFGVLVPLSPDKHEEVAGVEWYDSGIGFAVPLAHVNSVLPRLSEGDLKPGIMGVSLASGDLYTKPATIVACRPTSPAYKAGFKAGDQIIEIDGRPVERQAQLRERINRHYAGDSLHVVVLRGEERIEREITLVDTLEPYARPFLGLLPKRDTSAAAGGVPIRFVYPDSPAAKAGLKSGDVLISIDGHPTATRDALVERTAALEIGTNVKLVARRTAETLTFDLTPVIEPTTIPDTLPAAREASAPGAEASEDRPQTGSFAVKLAEYKNECSAYVPENYDARASYGLVVWLHPPGGAKDDELLARWREPCDAQNLILLAPRAANPERWMPPEVDFVAKAVAQIRKQYNIDPQRVVVQGQQAGGSLAYMVAFLHRDVVRGVAAIDAPFMGRIPENDPATRLTIFTTTAKKANFAEPIANGIEQFRKLKYTLTVVDQGETARDLDANEFAELLRWIDSLDKF